MFSEDYLRKIYKYYDDQGDINVNSFRMLNLHTLLKTLILYKELDDSIESYNTSSERLNAQAVGATSFGEFQTTLQNTLFFILPDTDVKYPGWFNKEWKDELMSTFLSRQLVNSDDDDKCTVYIDSEHHSTYVEIPKRMSIAGMQSILSGLLPKLLPWFFESVDKELVRKIATLSNDRNYNEFDKFFESTVRDTGIVSKIMQKDLETLGDRLKSSAKDMIESQISDYTSEVDSLFRRMCDVNDSLRQARSRLNAIMISDDRDNGINEIIEFLELTTQDIEIENVEEYTLKLKISSTLQQFDEWERYTNMDDCYLYNGAMSDEMAEYKRMYKTLFSNPDFKIHTCVGINMNLKTGYLSCYRPYYAAHETEHPHLNADFNCFGSAMAPIAEYIKSFRYTEALNQITYAARQFTVSDGAAGDKLLCGIRGTSCIELPTGEMVDAKGLREYLNETEGEVENE